MRWLIAALVVVGLALGVVLAWPTSTGSPTDALADTTTTTSTSLPPDTTSSVADTTTTTLDEGETSHVVETVEEAEEILRELWFGWFEGIYHEDEDRIREVVATEHQYGLASAQFGQMDFNRAPLSSDISYSHTELLETTPTCTVIWTTATFSGFTDGTSSDVHVLRWDNGWRFFSLWGFPEDLWEADCEAQLG